jgi:hypothetical protein
MNDYLYASTLGAFRASIMMPIEQPLDYLKTQIQSTLYRGPALNFIRNHISTHGFTRLFTGLVPNTLRASLKQAYRLPLMIYIPNFYRKFSRQENNIQIMTGMTIAVAESYIICPLERIKIWLMTSPEPTFRAFLEDGAGLKDFYSGVNALLMRQALSWVSFLGFTSLFKESVISYKGYTDFYDLVAIGMMVGVINTTVIMPADFIKTHSQKFGQLGGLSMVGCVTLLTQAEKNVFSKLMIVYCGWRVRVAHYLINSVATISLIDHLEKKFSTRFLER